MSVCGSSHVEEVDGGV